MQMIEFWTPKLMFSWCCARREGREGRAELTAAGDPELGKDAVQVSADCPVRQIQPLCDVPVREPSGGELGDLKLLGGQLVAGGEVAPAARFPGRPELPAGLVAPGGAAHGLEGVAGVPQRRTRVGDPALTRGYTARQGMVFYERLEPVDPGSAGVLGQLGGRMIRAGAWEQLGGMAREKELIERRVILPLAQPQLAERLGLVPPRAIVLFGPPGTGKTTFAKGAASRLGWPFVELFPSRLAGESPAGLAAALREAFSLVAELDKVVLFIDEVEEIAGARQPRTVSAAQGVTNEMLKLIPPFREQDERLLICATNSVRALDSAFLRHGRFDYVIPVGPPDPAAREAIWDRYLAAIPHGKLDMTAIVEESRLFTPADIEFAARRTAQHVFERVMFERGAEEATTADIVHAIGQTRRTLTPELVAEFEQDIQDHARV